jgi:crotonobetainyl-CoA:carnitine CoA-transferase CaiB-like acyl-CoA transferase
MTGSTEPAIDRIQPLRGCRVVDLSGYVTGPMASMMLADLGADVIKVEPPRGDPYRRIRTREAGAPLGALNVNRGKRGLTLNLKDAEDHATLRSLLATADVLIENWRPGVADRLGLDDATLEREYPTLIHLAISGYGPDGPLARQGSFDSLIQARTGLDLLRPADGRPAQLPTYLADKITSVFAAHAVLAALLDRTRTGCGGRLDVSMLDAVAYFNFPDVLEARTVVTDPSPGTSWLPAATRVTTTVRTADGWIAVSPTTREDVVATCELAGHPEWLAELAAYMSFGELAPELIRRLETVTVTRPSDEWLARFLEYDVPAAPVLDADGHLADPQVRHNQIYGELDDPVAGRVRYARPPTRFRRADGTASAPVAMRPMPAPDQHREEILRELQTAVSRANGAPMTANAAVRAAATGGVDG